MNATGLWNTLPLSQNELTTDKDASNKNEIAALYQVSFGYEKSVRPFREIWKRAESAFLHLWGRTHSSAGTMTVSSL